MTKEGDIVLIYYQGKPTLYARIESIDPDIKKNWYQVTLMLLSIPIQIVTWILREEYINGTDFTMGGHAMKIEKIDSPPDMKETIPDEGDQKEPGSQEKGKIIEFKKKNKDI
jgi:hypothetical protein